MARRFGGKYSPASAPPRPRSPLPPGADPHAIPPERLPQLRHPLAGRPVWIAAAALPMLLGAFGEGPVHLARHLAGFALIAGAAALLREGLRAEAAFDARCVARRPALPRKMFAALGFGAGLGLGATSPELGLPGAAMIGLIGFGLMLAGFGLDPMRDKGIEGIDRLQQDRAARAVAEAEAHLAAMGQAIARAGDPRLETRVALFSERARALFRAVEEDPADLAAARRYLSVYLDGARAATVQFADLYSRSRDAEARHQYDALLDDLEANFAARTASLAAGGREGLEIEIEVLRERLAREGIATEPAPDHTAAGGGPEGGTQTDQGSDTPGPTR